MRTNRKRTTNQEPRTTHHGTRAGNHGAPTTHHAPRTTHHAPRTTGKGERATVRGPWAKFRKIGAQDATANAEHSQTQQARGIASKIQSNIGNARSIARNPSEQTIGKKIARGLVLCTARAYKAHMRRALGRRLYSKKGENMKTFFVLAADFAYRTAVIEGSHISKKTAEKHAQSLPERWPDGSRPIVVSYTEMKRMQAPNRNGVSWAIYA